MDPEMGGCRRRRSRKTKSIKPTETKMRDARPDKWAQREEPGQVPVMVEIGGRLRNFPTAK